MLEGMKYSQRQKSNGSLRNMQSLPGRHTRTRVRNTRAAVSSDRWESSWNGETGTRIAHSSSYYIHWTLTNDRSRLLGLKYYGFAFYIDFFCIFQPSSGRKISFWFACRRLQKWVWSLSSFSRLSHTIFFQNIAVYAFFRFFVRALKI